MKSHSIPPRELSICVYVIRPTSRATWLSQSRSSSSAAPGPAISSLENELSSNSAAASRQAACSAPIAGDQFCPAQPRGRSPSSPAAAFESYQLTRSQPDFSPKNASCSRCQAFTEDTLSGRPASRSCAGYLMS